MRKIELSAVIPVGDSKMAVKDLIFYALKCDVRFNSNYEGIRSAIAIDTALKAAKDNCLILEEAEWEKLSDSLRSPSPMTGNPPYPVSPALSLIPLLEKVFQAEKYTVDTK